MARIRLILDTRKSSKSATSGLYPVALRLFHKRQRLIRLPYYTSMHGWDNSNHKFKKSVLVNKSQDCDYINKLIYDRCHLAKKLIDELGDTLNTITVDSLVEHIKIAWSEKENSTIKQKITNTLSLEEWGEVIINRKLKANQPGTAKWYRGAINAIKKFNKGKDIKLYDITVTFLKEFEAHHDHLGNSKNGISAYLRGIRSIYNSAIKEDRFIPIKNSFMHYKIPRTTRTKKRAISKEKLLAIRDLEYGKGTEIWHTKNYVLVMFNCRGMNFIDLAKLKVKDVDNDRLRYGRSKTGQPLSVKITVELALILSYYLVGEKEEDDFIFPVGYDGSPENYKHYMSHRRRVNKQLKIIGADAGIEQNLTTYSIRHSWATIAKFLGVSIEVISESLGHNSLKTTEIYLKHFHNEVLDEANEKVVS
ncbi:tyrosine-type recombinase/integrase [Sinomicrobium pectinilyticum]|nr:site-specific integrase [Sinomicrobium pectinilyticum]